MPIELTAERRRHVRSLYQSLHISVRQYIAWKLRLDPIFAHIDPVVPQAGRILDAGCGFGLMSNILAMGSSQRQILGLDIDPRKVHAAQHSSQGFENVRYEIADLLTCEFPPADCVILTDVLHYWLPEKQQHIIAKAAACLPSGGMLLFRDAMRTRSWGQRLVHWTEWWGVRFGGNPRGDGLCFQDREFFMDTFTRHGLKLRRIVPEWGVGSTVGLILDKGE